MLIIDFSYNLQDSANINEILENVYYNLGKAGAFQSASKIYQSLKNKRSPKISLPVIKKWLKSKDDYTLQKTARRKFNRPAIVTTGLYDLYDADLAQLDALSKYNEGVKYLLFVIDVFSRYLYIEPLIDKSGGRVKTALKSVFERGVKPKHLRTDGGSEFQNRIVNGFLQKENIYHQVVLNETKANYAERCIRTIKSMLYRYFTKYRTYKYIDVLQNFVKTYNASPHMSLNGIAPEDVNSLNETQIWSSLYLRKRKNYSKKFNLNVGDLVRISHQKRPFMRGYDEQFTTEIFKISYRFRQRGYPMYRLVDFLDEKVKGNFYEPELQSVEKNTESLWLIEKIIRKRQRRGRKEVYVKFVGWDDRFNSWILESEVKDMNLLK